MNGMNLNMAMFFGQILLELFCEHNLRQLTIVVRFWWIVIVSRIQCSLHYVLKCFTKLCFNLLSMDVFEMYFAQFMYAR